MVRVFILIVVVLGLFNGCSNEGLPSGDRAGGIMFSDMILRDKIYLEFEKSGIPFEVDRNGFTNFLLKDQSKVLGIVRDIKFGEELSQNHFESVVVHSEKAKDKYIFELRKKEIPFDVESYDGETQISWPQTYGSKVDSIQQKINIELRRENRNKAVEEGEVPARLIESLNK